MVQTSTGVELDYSVGLEVDGFCIVAGEDAEGLVERVGVAGKRERQVRQVVGVDLGLEGVSRVFVLAWRKALTLYVPVDMTQSPSSLTRTHWLASSKPKSCSNSTRFANSGSFFKLLLRISARLYLQSLLRLRTSSFGGSATLAADALRCR